MFKVGDTVIVVNDRDYNLITNGDILKVVRVIDNDVEYPIRCKREYEGENYEELYLMPEEIQLYISNPEADFWREVVKSV